MAQKVREILSELMTDIKALNLDDRVSFRYLYSKFNGKVQYFLRLEAKSREFVKDNTVWKPIHCFELIEAPANCCSFQDECNTLKRSKELVPEAYNTNYGQLIKILTVDGYKEFTLIKSHEYKDYINREYKTSKLPAWIENQYLFIPNVTIESVKILIIPKNAVEVDKLNCEATACASPLDGIVTYPDYLITLAKKEVLNELLGTKPIREDEKGDDNTNNK